MKVLIISADEFEEAELLVPYYRLLEEGIDVDIAAPVPGRIRGKHGYEIEAGLGIDAVWARDYAALIVPGGRAPAKLRENAGVRELVRAIFTASKPVAAICHGPQVLVSAGVLSGRRATCYRTIARELESAGARYQDAEVVVDGNLITSRQPADLPAFMRELIRQLRDVQPRAEGAWDIAL